MASIPKTLLLWAIGLLVTVPVTGLFLPLSSPFSSSSRSVSLAHRSQFHFLPYQLTDACFQCSRPNETVLYSCSIEFNWFDPNSVKENNVTSCNCTYTWQWNGSTAVQGDNNTFDNTDFLVCLNQYSAMFEMRVDAFTAPTNLTLTMSHHYKDSTLWGPPYLYVQTWATPVLNLIKQSRNGTAMCYYTAGPILANITGLQD